MKNWKNAVKKLVKILNQDGVRKQGWNKQDGVLTVE